jgi:hypothetical protein
LEGRTTVIPQTWDADTPQVPKDAAQNDPEGETIISVEDESVEVLPAEAAVSGTERQEESRPVPTTQQQATREGQGSLIVRIKARIPTPAVDITEGNEQPGSTAEFTVPGRGTATEEQPTVQVEEPQSEQPRSEDEQPLKDMLVDLAVEEEIPATQPMEAAAESLAAVLQKECGIMPTSSVDMPQGSGPSSATTPQSRKSGTHSEGITRGDPQPAQTDKVLTMAETLLDELITWKELVDQERTDELQVRELRQRLARAEEQLRYKGTAYNIAIF